MDLFDYKPELTRLPRRGTARLGASRPAADRHDLAANELPRRRLAVRVCPARPERRLAQRVAAAHRRRGRRFVLRQKRLHRSDQSRPGDHVSANRRQLAGRPSIGAWLAYGLGSENRDLPAFVAMVSQGSGNPTDQPLYDRLWGSGFLPSKYQGVKFRSVGDPVLNLSNPPGIDTAARRAMLDDLARSTACSSTSSATPRSPRASRNTSWPSACSPACPN